MKALVIIFALLGILGSVGLGAVFSSVMKDDSAKDDSISVRQREINELSEAVKASDELSADERKDLTAGLEALKGALGDMQKIPIPLFVSGGLGLLMMILAIANAGPRPLHGVGFLLAGILPAAWTFIMVTRPISKGSDLIGKLQPKLGFGSGGGGGATSAAEATGPLLAMVSAGAAAFLLAGLFAFFVKGKTQQAATAVPAPAPMA